MINPYACVNDGLVDITWLNDPALNCLTGVVGMLDKAKAGGVQVYDHQNKYFRGKQITFKYKGRQARNPPVDHGTQMFTVDGEDLHFLHSVKWDVMPKSIEICFDAESYFNEYNWFNKKEPHTEDKAEDFGKI